MAVNAQGATVAGVTCLTSSVSDWRLSVRGFRHLISDQGGNSGQGARLRPVLTWIQRLEIGC